MWWKSWSHKFEKYQRGGSQPQAHHLDILRIPATVSRLLFRTNLDLTREAFSSSTFWIPSIRASIFFLRKSLYSILVLTIFSIPKSSSPWSRCPRYFKTSPSWSWLSFPRAPPRPSPSAGCCYSTRISKLAAPRNFFGTSHIEKYIFQYLLTESAIEIWLMEIGVIFYSISLKKFNDQDTLGNYSPDLCCLMLLHGRGNSSFTKWRSYRPTISTQSTHIACLLQWLHPWSSTRWYPSRPW